jgi:phosphate/sulfate permease
LQLRLDDAGVEVVPGYPPSFVEIERRMKKAKVGLGVSAGVSAVGLAMGLAAAGGSLCLSWDAVGATGAALFVGGLIGMFFGGVMLRKHKQDRNNLREAHYGTQRRAQWDLARSRLVF